MNMASRYSWLLVPADDQARVAEAAQSGANVVVLDLVELVHERNKAEARNRVQGAIATVEAAGAEAHVMIDPALGLTDLTACMVPGLTGVLVSRAEQVEQIERVDALLASLEHDRGLQAGSVEITLAFETALGNRDAVAMATASPRVRSVTLGRADLIMDLRPEPSGELHLMPHLLQRLALLAAAVGVTPIGAWWKAPARGLLASSSDTYAAACRGRSVGYQGALCLLPEQVRAVNLAYEGRR